MVWNITRTEVHCECHALMCVSIEHMLTVALSAESFQSHATMLGDPSNPLLASQLRRECATRAPVPVLLLSRALEAHASDSGREAGRLAGRRRARRLDRAHRRTGTAGHRLRWRARAILEVSSGLLRIAQQPDGRAASTWRPRSAA